jgi:hypothetical protein
MQRIVLAVAVLTASIVGSDALSAPAGASCAAAITLASNSSYVSDTTITTNWMTSFGPLVSPANDQLYTFTAGAQPLGTITPTAASYAFAMYLIPSCSDSGTEPAPIKATATVGLPIDLGSGITQGAQYYLAVTGIAAGGAGANGTVNFDGFWPVTLQTFTVD